MDQIKSSTNFTWSILEYFVPNIPLENMTIIQELKTRIENKNIENLQILCLKIFCFLTEY